MIQAGGVGGGAISPGPRCPSVSSDHDRWLKVLNHYGLCLVTDIPDGPEEIVRVCIVDWAYHIILYVGCRENQPCTEDYLWKGLVQMYHSLP